jgi:hypothetical protein
VKANCLDHRCACWKAFFFAIQEGLIVCCYEKNIQNGTTVTVNFF